MLKDWADQHNIPDDAEIWLEYPEQLAQPEVRDYVELKTESGHVVEDFDAIQCMSYVFNPNKNRFYIQHHF